MSIALGFFNEQSFKKNKRRENQCYGVSCDIADLFIKERRRERECKT